MEKKLEDIKLGFLPLPLFVILAIILVAAELTGKMTVNLYTGALVCALFGCAMRFVVDHVSIIEKTIGGAFVALSCATFVYFNLVPEDWVEACKIFIDGDIDFLTCYVITLICGTILTMDRKVLIKVGIRYFVPIFGGLIFAYGLGALAGQVLGIGWKHAIMYIAGPIMGGGNGAGAVPMSEIYSSVNGVDKAVIYSELHAMTTLGNWVSIFFAIILNVVGQKRPETTGNGEIMKGLEVKAGKLEYDYKFDFSDLLTGAAIAAGVLLIVYQLVPQFDLLKILKFSPVILIALGIEMLVYSARPDVKVKFDWLAMLGTAFTLCIVGTAALLPLAISEWNPARDYARNRIESQKADAMYSALTADPALKAKLNSLNVEVRFFHEADGDYTLQSGDDCILYAALQGPYADAETFAADCMAVMQRAADDGLGFTCYHFDADEDIDDGISYYLDCVASYPAGLTAAQVAQRVQASYHYDNNSFSSEADRDDYIRRQLQNEISDEYADRHDGAYPDEKYLNEETERRFAERTGMATPESAQA